MLVVETSNRNFSESAGTIEPISLGFSFVCDTINDWISVFAIIVFLLLSYSVTLHSPKQIGSFKFYILWNSLHGVLFNVIVFFVRPDFLAPYSIVVFHRRKLDFWFPEINNLFWLFITNILQCGLAFTMSMMFVFRYAQTAQNNSLLQWLSRMRNYTILYLIYASIMQLINYYPTVGQLLTEEDLNRLWPTVSPLTLQLFENRRIVLAMDPTITDFVWLDTLSILVSYVLPSVVMIMCTLLSFRSFQLQQNQLHINTRRLYRTLLIVVVLELISAALMILAPLTYYVIFTYYDTKFSSWMYKIFTILINMYPLLSDLIILIFITPYRKAIISLFKFNRTVSLKSYIAPRAPIVVFTKTTRSLSVNPT